MRKISEMILTSFVSFALILYFQYSLAYQNLYELSESFIIEVAHKGVVDDNLLQKADELDITITCASSCRASLGDMMNLTFSKPLFSKENNLLKINVQIERNLVVGFSY